MPRIQVLEGVRIVDLSHAHAGPFGTQILGDMGADVIKIEPPNTGELTRAFYPGLGEGMSYYYLRNRKRTGKTFLSAFAASRSFRQQR